MIQPQSPNSSVLETSRKENSSKILQSNLPKVAVIRGLKYQKIN